MLRPASAASEASGRRHPDDFSRLMTGLIYTGFESRRPDSTQPAAANNRLELPYARTWQRSQGVYADVCHELSRLIKRHNPDVIIGVPPVAEGYGDRVAAELRMQSFRLGYNRASAQPVFRGAMQTIMQSYQRIAVVHDVLDGDDDPLHQVLGMPDIAGKVAVVGCVWDRRDIEQSDCYDAPTVAVVREPIPDVLESDDPLWDLARAHRSL